MRALTLAFTVAVALGASASGLADVSPELPVANPATLPATGEYPQAAASGGTVLVVWRDLVRLGVYGARVTSDGTVLDIGGILLFRPAAPDPSNIPRPHVAGSPNGWMVVWGSGMRRVALDGSLPDATPIVQLADDVASDGTDWVVTYPDLASDQLGRSIWAAPVSANGEVGVPHEASVAVGERSVHGNPRIVFGGMNYLIAFNDGLFVGEIPDVYGVRVDRSAAPVAAVFPICVRGHEQRLPVVAFDGTNYLVAWEDERSTFGTQIFGARVSQDGQVLDPDPNLPLHPVDQSRAPGLAFAQGEYFLTWGYFTQAQGFAVAGIRVGIDGVPFPGDPLVLSEGMGAASNPTAAPAGTHFLVAYAKDPVVQGGRVASDGTLEDVAPISISFDRNAMNAPSVAFDGNSYLVSWADQRTQPVGPAAIYSARLSPTGTMLDPDGIRLTAPTPLSERNPTTASNGSGFLVSWVQDVFGLFARKVTSAGVPEGDPIPIAGDGQHILYRLASASDGNGYLVVYVFGDVLTAVTVTAGGSVGTPAPIATVDAITQRVGIGATFDGTNYIVVFSNREEAFYSRVTPAGQVLDVGGQSAGTGYFPRVASERTGEASLMVWATDSGALARRIRAGTTVDATRIPIGTPMASPQVAFDGESYVVTWASQGTLGVARLSTAGAITEGPYPVGPMPGTIDELSMTSGPSGKVLLTYTRNASGNGETWARLISAGAPVSPNDAGVLDAADAPPAATIDAPRLPDARSSGTSEGCGVAGGSGSAPIDGLIWIAGALVAARLLGRRRADRSSSRRHPDISTGRNSFSAGW